MTRFLAAAALFATTAHLPAQGRDKDLAYGKSKYVLCMACHQADGKGAVGAIKMAPSFGDSKIVKMDSAEAMAMAVLKGIKKEPSSTYVQIMMPLETSFAKDEDLAAVLNYVRTEWGEKKEDKDLVTADQVKEWRAKYAPIKTQIERAKLDEMLAEEEKKKKAKAKPAADAKEDAEAKEGQEDEEKKADEK